MGVFITVKINKELCDSGCAACVEACPVKIFIKNGDKVEVDPSNEDECTLCEICLERCPKKALELVKNY